MVWNIRALLLHKIQLLVLVNSRTKQLGAAVSWTSKPLLALHAISSLIILFTKLATGHKAN